MSDLSAATAASPAQYDLRSFLRRIKGFHGGRALTTTPLERPPADSPVELLDADNVVVSADPMDVVAFVDGIQASIYLTHRQHRPIYMTWTAAGAVGAGPRIVGLEEQMAIVCSTMDRDWVKENNAEGFPVRELAALYPPDVEGEAAAMLGQTREGLERHLVDRMLIDEVGTLVLDGSLIARPNDRRLVGVVKTMGKRYLPDESFLWRLPVGSRSPRFKILPRTPGASIGGVPRYSCYVRLFDATYAAWNFGMVRLETFDPELLDTLAARCLLERQGVHSLDPRADRHLASVRATEDVLRARRPVIFGK